ncbi:hypothetical protein D3C87_1133320 [compost metagenome]|uniref:hypothetical protein n=1 Tax=Achromobacter sp. TaxID=134375 RepID=UPI000FB7F8B9|nr:hypothetical protein [Achromobacter sp.]
MTLLAILYIPILMFAAIALVAAGVGTFVGIALHGQEIYAWVIDQPALGLLAAQFAIISKLKIDPSGISSDARFLNDGLLGMMSICSAGLSIALCYTMLAQAVSMVARCISSFVSWRRARNS